VDVHPVDAAIGRPAATAYRVAERVQAVDDQSVNPVDAGLHEDIQQVISYPARHDQRPGARCLTSWSSQPLPSGSLNDANDT
jgi:hypothetical protein